MTTKVLTSIPTTPLDFLLTNPSQASTSPASTFFHAEPVVGQCHVMTFSRHHNRTLADLSPHEISSIIQTWKDLYISYRDTSESEENGKKYAYMQIFENKGPAMGCSNPHPHCQIWTTSSIPDEVRVESENMSKYQLEKRNVGEGKRHMLQDYVLLEIEKRERVIYESQDDDGEDGDGGKGLWVVVVPWWAVWPFEVMIIPKEHRKSLADLSTFEMKSLAKAISEVCKRYDNLFKCRFPYSKFFKHLSMTNVKLMINVGMGIHQAPLHDSQEVIDAAYLHIHFYPPLLRSATVRKFLVGYEMLAEPQRDITPEQAASGLRDCGGPLYRDIKD